MRKTAIIFPLLVFVFSSNLFSAADYFAAKVSEMRSKSQEYMRRELSSNIGAYDEQSSSEIVLEYLKILSAAALRGQDFYAVTRLETVDYLFDLFMRYLKKAKDSADEIFLPTNKR